VARRRSVRIDMTPMVDVAFLLLIFFMSTTQFKPPEQIAVRLPASTSQIHVPETGTIILTLNREGQLFISSEAGNDIQEVPRESALEAILAWRSRNPAAVVVLKGDRDAPFGEIADLMDALAEAKTLRFNLMTDLKRKESTEQETARSQESTTEQQVGQPGQQQTEPPGQQPTEPPR
jgi:biopolymer transport protein ExbD